MSTTAVQTVSPKYLTCAETSQLVRAALKAAFPGVTFSVRSKTYSGGASMNVSWTDGPTYDEVNRVAGRFAGASFDGMIDLKSYHVSEHNGQAVHFGADYVFCSRRFSPALIQRAASYANRMYGWTLDATNASDRDSDYGLVGGRERAFEHWNYTKAERVYQIIREMRPNGCIVRLK